MFGTEIIKASCLHSNEREREREREGERFQVSFFDLYL